ncbi:efflux transporter outer membrane subunit [Burkholderia pseudomallei]|uniref:efflux transporter outer membrane subunit n=1 Tax=Burkholderia pseudomallei TaxID=28450 RepID=UPI00052A494A|nr:efflux transporter outer membrane subunit [Burkholderia pseudomallei]AIV86622.1 efflux transporter, outer membrane factor (OMF) lipo, NodT family protein [Burkholderia pseudomallei B03]AIV94297.1 efflux transporter, outer membrane factor (OMF) lipo, NodT family protein [Burkholderia pseudomallei A79A]KGY05252.1 efflux transporter, outer membrane factor (OMF) lipo, NodT family protein [Burkholderia pseudomallei A79D]KGY06316.1 efflux transporter, outer membrane factor (OMF) lipo, NodT family 
MTTRPIHRLARRAAALAGTLALLSGCTSASRNAPPPAPELPAQWAGPVARQASATPDGWWRRFGDPMLDRLIDDALRTNNDLAAAAIRVYRAQLQAGLADTNLTPNVTLGATGNASRTLDTHQTRRTSGVTATLGYELDLWGKLAAQRDAARWELEATQADRDAARLALIGTTAALYWQLAYLNQQIAFGDANIAYAERTLKLVQSRHAAGATSGLDLAQAERNLAALRADQTQLIQQRTENRNALAILFDRPPQRQAAERDALPDTPLPEVAAGVPAELLGRRPDLRAAELRLRESLANVDVTRTSFYPTFTLTGSVGTASTSLERVLQNPVATLGLGLALPFIQWNTMQLQIKVSKSQYEEAVVNFRQSLYRALGEVENALAARVQLDAEADERGRALALARRAETLAKARFAAGATGVQPWLDEQQRLRDAQSALARNQLGRLNNRMNLYQVLGGAG